MVPFHYLKKGNLPGMRKRDISPHTVVLRCYRFVRRYRTLGQRESLQTAKHQKSKKYVQSIRGRRQDSAKAYPSAVTLRCLFLFRHGSAIENRPTNPASKYDNSNDTSSQPLALALLAAF